MTTTIHEHKIEAKPSQDKMLSFSEVGKRLGVSNHTVRKLATAGAMHSFAPGPGLPRRIWESELKRFRERTKGNN